MLNEQIWIYDFEVFSKINWWCVSFFNKNTEEVITIINDRNALIDFYEKHKDDIVCGYNSRQYDQYQYKGILDDVNPSYINDQIINFDKKGFQVVKNAKKYPLNNYDVILKDKSLKQLEAYMGDTIKETDVPFDIDRPLTEEEVKQIISYNIHDCKETGRVLDFTIDDFNSQIDMLEMFELDQQMFNKTKAQLAAHILGAVPQHSMDDEFEYSFPETLVLSKRYEHIVEWYKNPLNWTYKNPLCSESKQDVHQLITIVGGCEAVFGSGGLHAAISNIICEGILLCMDVGSLYPSIDIEYDYISRTIVEPKKYTLIRDTRLVLKAQKNPKQLPYKIVLNATYGAKKDRNNALYDPLMSNNTCLTGQLLMTDLCDKIEDYGKVLQINTDGIYMVVDSVETANKIISISNEWEKRTRLSLDFDIYEQGKLIQKDVNNYILIDKSDGHYKCKGAYVKELSPIDNDLPIINKALIDYFVNDIPVETTINECNDLIAYQKVIKLTNLYKGVVYGEGKKVKIDGKDKIMVDDGIQLKEKVHRVFASTRIEDKGIYKVKIEKGQKSYEKVSYTPERCFIDNESLDVDWYFDKETKSYKYNSCRQIPEYLDKQYYIDLSNERIRQFIEVTEEKVDNTPTILYDCMCKSNNFYEFLSMCKNEGITDKLLEGYLIADCCNVYGKTQKLLDFKDYFNLIYGKDKFTVKNIEKKITDPILLNIIISNAELGKTGKSYTNFDSKKALLEIFNTLENKDINAYDIMEMQVKKFNRVRYKDETLSNNRWFILNTRNIIAPNLIMYNMKTGEVKYRKIKKEVFNILPLQDGDIIDELKSEIVYGVKSIGKDERGINILAADIDKEYDVITKYEIVYRNYNKDSRLASDNGEEE